MSSVLIASAISRKVPSPRMALCDLLATPARRMHENLMTADDRYGQRDHNGPTALPFWLDSVHCPPSASGRESLQSERFQEIGDRTMDNVDGKVAFITGGASGIGLGLAKVLVKAGAKVVMADVRQDHFDEAKE